MARSYTREEKQRVLAKLGGRGKGQGKQRKVEEIPYSIRVRHPHPWVLSPNEQDELDRLKHRDG